jgi:hypothetical protein
VFSFTLWLLYPPGGRVTQYLVLSSHIYLFLSFILSLFFSLHSFISRLFFFLLYFLPRFYSISFLPPVFLSSNLSFLSLFLCFFFHVFIISVLSSFLLSFPLPLSFYFFLVSQNVAICFRTAESTYPVVVRQVWQSEDWIWWHSTNDPAGKDCV